MTTRISAMTLIELQALDLSTLSAEDREEAKLSIMEWKHDEYMFSAAERCDQFKY